MKPLVADPLTVDAGHVIAGVTHDVVDGHLILGISANRFEGVSQAVEPQTRPVDFQFPGQPRKSFRKWIVALVVPLRSAVLPEKNQSLVALVLGRRAKFQGLLQRLNRLRP